MASRLEADAFIGILTDTGRISGGGESLEKWAEELLSLVLEHRKILGSGGLLVPQLGEGSGLPKPFIHKDPSTDLAVDLNSVREATDSFWETVRTEEVAYRIRSLAGSSDNLLIVSPISLGFDKPIGYFWVLVEEREASVAKSLVRYCSVLASLCIMNNKASTAFNLLAQPIWRSMDSLPVITGHAAKLCLSALACKAVIVWVTTPFGELKTLVSAGEGCENLDVDMRIGEGFAGRCAREIELMNVDDLWLMADDTAHPRIVREKGFRSGIFAPLDVGDVEAAGVFAAYGVRPRAFSEIDENIVRTIAHLLTTSYVQSKHIQDLEEMRKKVQLEGPAIETGLLAIERIHDINNELVFAQNSMNFIIDRLKTQPKSSTLNDARQASRHIENANRTMKALAKRAKLTEFYAKSCNLKSVLEKVRGDLLNQIEEIKAKIYITCPEDISVVIDQEQMERVFANILGNSIYFLATVSRERKTIEIKVEKIGDAVEIKFRDNGPGIYPYVKHKVFDVFFTTKGGKGMGFGLAIARRIVEQHKGTIIVVSEWGSFTEFTVRLPA